MSLLHFPSNPTVGQQYANANGIVYTWDGVKWLGAVTGSTISTIGYGTYTVSVNTAGNFVIPAGAIIEHADGSPAEFPGGTLINGPYSFTLTTSGSITLNGEPFHSGGVIQSSTPPVPASTSTLWYDIGSGRSYVYYDGTWVDAAPEPSVPTHISAFTNDVGYITATNTLVNGVYSVSLGVDGYLNLPNGLDTNGAVIQSGSPIRIISNTNVWNFGAGGALTFPDSTQQTTAWTGSVDYGNITNAPVVNSTGTTVFNVVSATTIYINGQPVSGGTTSTLVSGTYTFAVSSTGSVTLNGVSFSSHGAQGTTGAQGTAGSNGTNGAQGTTGATGAQGTAGSNGTNGAQGTTGSQGTAGSNGNNGSQGTTGSTGSQGTAGSIGTNGTQGTTGAQGTAGSIGTNGTQGTTGAQGTTGTNGVQGVQGISGSASLNNLSTSISFSNTGVNPPSFVTTSTGVKISYYQQESPTTVDYATGIEPGGLWTSIPSATSNYVFKWYGGTSTIATLTGTGTFITNTLNVSNQITTPAGSNANLVLNPDGLADVIVTTSTQILMYATNTSISTTTGALVVTGGVGVGGTVTANKFVGDGSSLTNVTVTQQANIVGVQPNVTLVAGSYSYLFDNTGNFTMPTNGDIVMPGTGSVISLGGNITMPNRPAFRVYGAGTTNNLSTTVNTNGILNGNNFAVDYNQGTALSTSTGVFTAPVAGLYSIHLVARVTSNSAGQSQVTVIKNNGLGSQANQAMWETGPNPSINHFGASTISKLAVGDTLVAKVTLGSINFDSNDSWAVAYIG